MTKARTLADNYAADINQVTANAPLTGGGTSGTVTVGIQAGTTAQSGAVQLTDSTASTSTTTAATPNSVKSAYDLANGAIAKSLVDAKGDLLVGSANDTVSRLAVASTAGYVLTVDSAEATGLKWAAVSSTPTYAGCQINNTSDLSVVNNTEVLLTFNSETFDTDGYHSTSTNTGRITIPSGKAGYYRFYSFVAFLNNATGLRQLIIKKNGTNQNYTQTFGNANQRTGLSLETTIYCAVSDYVELYVYQDSGSTLDIGGGTLRFYFGADYLGA